MPSDAKDTFVLFDIGHGEDMLRLGDLVLYNYNDPLNVRHYTCKQEPKVEAVSSTHLTNFLAVHKRGPQAAIQLEGAGFFNLGTNLNLQNSTLLVAGSGDRVVLKNPDEYLSDVVLADEKARKALALWLSAGTSQRLLKFKWAKRPKIWMMTGMYLFQNTKLVTTRSRDVGASAGLSQDIVALLTSAPVGGSVNVSKSMTMDITTEFPEKRVWAAQYQLLDARYIDLGSSMQNNSLAMLTLYPDITLSRGQLRSSEAVPQRVEVNGVHEEVEMRDDDMLGSSISELDEEEIGYMKTLEEVITSYEAVLEAGSSDEEED